MILEEPPFEEEEYIEEENEYADELVYHSELVDERFVSAHQQMYSSTSDIGDDRKIRQKRDTNDSISSWVTINEFDKRKKLVLDKLGIQL
jgi:hypothetical protein